MLIAVLAAMSMLALSHPANIAVARAKVDAKGSVELTVTFDILAFTLDQTPTTVLDAPMTALADGPEPELQTRLTDAKERFLAGLAIAGGEGNPVIDKVDWPNATEVRQVANSGQQPRLPVMMTATIHAHLAPATHRIGFNFAEVLGDVVLSTEFPYFEPTSCSVEPGDTSELLEIPSAAEIARLAGLARSRGATSDSAAVPSEADAKAQIQLRYAAWSKAYMAHDVDTLEAILAPDYTLKTAQGTLINAGEYRVMLNLRKSKHSDTTHYSTEILRITMRGGIAAIWSRETTTDPATNGQTTPVSYLHDYVDLWVWTDHTWRLRSTVTQTETVIPTVR